VFVGSRKIQITDSEINLSFPSLVFYPTTEPSQPTAFGPYVMDIRPDAGVAEGAFPLVVVSHGNGGSYILHRTIGVHLAEHGYIVALLEHPGNNFRNNDLEGSTENLVNRPMHVRLTIDAVMDDSLLGAAVEKNTVAVIGHSMGGYTALAVAGGTPWTADGNRLSIVPDPRVKAIVLLTPATGWFIPKGSLENVTVPILMLAAEHDEFTPPWNAEVVLKRIPDRSQVTFRIIENAGHFSFLSPYPPNLKNAGFPPSMDPEGFDRDKFHKELPGELCEFLDEKLKKKLHPPAAAKVNER
jgi:predicted dienelactone hydrolase